MIILGSEQLPIKIWAEAADLEGYDAAIDQAKNLANHPAARSHIALMPDFHVGYGMPIGGVLACENAVVPNAVGVDIGCGMMALPLALEASSLTRDNLESLRQAIHARVPVGNGPQGEHKDGADSKLPEVDHGDILQDLFPKARVQMGTLGGGNHFIELDQDEDGQVWLMLHSGSRALGQKVCTAYEKQAQMHNSRWYSQLPDKELAFLPVDSGHAASYLQEMTWCMKFAEMNRHAMLQASLAAFTDCGISLDRNIQAHVIETHHNYAVPEKHRGKPLWVHRKGAVKAEGKLIIPGSMGTASYICEGLNNPESFGSCSHGAGRVLGRRQANRTITHERAVESMGSVVFGIREGDYEEMPDAYKDIDRVIELQLDLLRPLHRLTPLAVVKG